jgi:hypothetical protein
MIVALLRRKRRFEPLRGHDGIGHLNPRKARMQVPIVLLPWGLIWYGLSAARSGTGRLTAAFSHDRLPGAYAIDCWATNAASRPLTGLTRGRGGLA